MAQFNKTRFNRMFNRAYQFTEPISEVVIERVPDINISLQQFINTPKTIKIGELDVWSIVSRYGKPLAQLDKFEFKGRYWKLHSVKKTGYKRLFVDANGLEYWTTEDFIRTF